MKAFNHELNQRRAQVENAFGRMKILSVYDGYRGERSNAHDLMWIGANLTNIDIRLHPLRSDPNHLLA